MLSDILDSENLCLKITDLLEQDTCSLSASLQGDILDAYNQLIQVELDKIRDIRRLLQQIEAESQKY